MNNSIVAYNVAPNRDGWTECDLNGRSTPIPSTWSVLPLGKAASIIAGQSPDGQLVSKGEPTENHIDFHQGNADFGIANTSLSGKIISRENAPRIAQKGTLLLSVRAPVGAVNIASNKICFGRGLCAIEAGKNSNSTYLRQALLRSREHLNEISTGSTFVAVTTQQVNLLQIFLPPLPEQERIARVLSTQEDRIDDLRAWAKTERQRLTWLTDELLSGRVRVVERQGGAETVVEVDENGVSKEVLGAFELVPNREECKEIDINGKISKFPSAWMKQKISEHFEVSMGKTILSKDISKFDGDNLIPVFSATEDKKIFGYINRETLSASDLLDDGDIVIGARGTLGKPKLMTGPSTSTQTTIQCKSKNTLCSSLVVIIGKIDTSWFSTSGSGVPMLTAATVKNIEMALPSPPEQQRIAAVLSAQERQIEDIERLIAVEQKRLAWLTEELLSGRIRVEACND